MLHELTAGPKTVHWGYLSSTIEPVLEISSGDIVTIEEFGSSSPADHEAAGVTPDQIPKPLKDIFKEVTDKGPGMHILTGPIYIKSAKPGDMLEVRIKDIDIMFSFGFNIIRCGMGVLPDDFPYDSRKVLRFDMQKMTSEVIPGVVIPLRPFFGTMGVAPPPSMGRITSVAPGVFGGNLDNKELISGTVLYLPVHVNGALFSVGDGHAAEGDGEVDLTAIETALKGKFQFFVHKQQRIKWPRAETPKHFITMGLNQDLDVAVQMAVRELIDFLVETKDILHEDAYRIASMAADLHVTQAVDGVKGIHAMIPKEIFKGKKRS